ncbi:hypothetical protein OCC_03372 [Thermococcus litoralis DSM 5473]|uniref:Uncharacterized protein n=1 Tax=Thermococcus litoralis (strain ATCC 51850 / DSM 5473 / JCM 8560 / NS-C) TaxID=523849 RepID=H3ZQ96_THELN|nr:MULTISPECIES: DUF6506 family protein [Thermococcus]EHR77890.1 hypothetical protein OCC_03372 [Thermococcus litoralis DSM 5473]MCO6040595.1 DUF6506 family protein [Thermococcus alcaliphilus]
MDKLKAAFIFLAPEAEPERHRAVISTPAVELHVVGVKNYDEACRIAKELVDEGIAAIELCGGFGHRGVAKIVEAVEGKVPVGVVRFDIHPGLEGKSGDEIF